MTTVVHVNEAAYDVYIGRPYGPHAGSKWANPFHIGKDGTREEVLRKYENWIVSNRDLLTSLGELKDKVLGCWCHLKECHGDVLAAMVNKLIM